MDLTTHQYLPIMGEPANQAYRICVWLLIFDKLNSPQSNFVHEYSTVIENFTRQWHGLWLYSISLKW